MKKILLILFLLIPSLAMAAPPQRQVSYIPLTTIRSDDVTANEDEIFRYLQAGVDTIRTGGLDIITEIDEDIRSGSDQTLITGTEGTSGQMSYWNSDGDLVGTEGLIWTPALVQMNIQNGIMSALTVFSTGIRNCDTVDTDANGKLICGSDSGAGTVNLVTGVTGTLPVANGGTGQTLATDDSILVGNGTGFDLKSVPNCPDTGGNHLNYTASTNALECGTTVATGFVTKTPSSGQTNAIVMQDGTVALSVQARSAGGNQQKVFTVFDKNGSEDGGFYGDSAVANLLVYSVGPINLIESGSLSVYSSHSLNGMGIPGSSTQTITAGATISANSCGGMKKISSSGDVTTSTSTTIGTNALTSMDCCMKIVNVGSFNITLDNNASTFTNGGADVVLGPNDSADFCGEVSTWYQIGATGNN